MNIRDWLETKRWYWTTLTFEFIPLPYHWQREFTRYDWGFRILFGPFGVSSYWTPKRVWDYDERDNQADSESFPDEWPNG